MQITTVKCDKCGKVCDGDRFIVYRIDSAESVIGKGDICETCYNKMLAALEGEEE